MITLKNIKKAFGDEIIFENVDLTINENEKIAIVGNNGVGKTTLLNVIKDEEYATFGEVITANHTIEFLDQEQQLANFITINDVITDLKREVTNISKQIDTILNDPNFATDEELIKEYGTLDTKFNLLGGYEIDSNIKKVLSNFNFTHDMYDEKLANLSGGQLTRLALAKLIIKNPDYLVLDEPTNHLDFKTIEWLEQYLRLKAKGVIIISHDRFFINSVCTKIVELQNKTLTVYNTNYDGYLEEKKRRYEHLRLQYDKQQKEIAHMEEFIEKFRAKASKVGQVSDRKNKLEKMEKIVLPPNDFNKINFKIDNLNHKKNTYIELIDATIGYDEPLIKNLNFKINAQDRIGVLGENGSGKSTLIKTIMRKIEPLAGRSLLHPTIKVGYFDQSFLELDYEQTVYDYISELMDGETQTQIRKFLANFLFVGKDCFKHISMLSGGEKVRLTFAKLSLSKYDILIMDEPTNHLDMSTKEELENVLVQYEGTLLIVSHDRYFINKVVDNVLIIRNQSATLFEGNYETFLETETNVVEKRKSKIQKKKQTSNQNKTQSKKIEREIIELESQLESVTNLTLLKENYEDFNKMNELNKQIVSINEQLEKLYEKLI